MKRIEIAVPVHCTEMWTYSIRVPDDVTTEEEATKHLEKLIAEGEVSEQAELVGCGDADEADDTEWESFEIVDFEGESE